MLRIVTDGAADIIPAWENEFDIKVIPINVHFGEKTYIQNVDLKLDGFYKLVDDKSNPFPGHWHYVPRCTPNGSRRKKRG